MDFETVVFDLGGVLIRWDPRHLYRQLIPADEVEKFLEEVDFLSWNHGCDAGLPWDDAVAQLSARYPHRAELIAAYPARFGESLVGCFEDTVAILRELREAGVRLLALTNWPAESFRHARMRFDFLEWFDAIVVSGEEKVAKPDLRIFEILIERYALAPSRTLFIDDAAANVVAAEAVGLRATLFRDADQLRRELTRLQLLPPALTSGVADGSG